MKQRMAAVRVLALLMIVSLGTFARAQGNAPASPHPDSAAQSTSPGAELAKETKEADDSENLKHSAAVRMVAKLTGASTEQAFWICVLFNFAVLFSAIFWASRKTLPGAFRNRTASIQKAMQEARKASEEANHRLADIEARLSRLGTEINDMRAASEKEAMAEEARIKAAAEEDARKIVESAEQEIAAAAKAARRELTTYAADLAVSLAKKQIQVDSPTDQGLIRSFSRQLGQDGDTGKGGN